MDRNEPDTGGKAAKFGAPLVYPDARRAEIIEDHFGTKVADPYRWLEDPDTEESRDWIDAQNRLTFGFLSGIPERLAIEQRLRRLWNYEKFDVPFREGARWFWFKNDGLQNQAVLYTAASPQAPPRVLLDPNVLSAEGTVALSGVSVSRDGSLLAYGLSHAGSDWQEWRVREVGTGRDREDLLKWIKFSSASWMKDGSGFFYSRYAEPKPGDALEEANYHQKLYFHRIGEPQEKDDLVLERPDRKEWFFDGEVTEDGRYLVVKIAKGTGPQNLVYVKDLDAPGSELRKVVDDFEASFDFIANDGGVFWFKSDLAAPRGRVVRIDIENTARASFEEVVPESRDKLESVTRVGDRFFALYLRDAHSAVLSFDLMGNPLQEIALPGLGTAAGFRGKRSDTETYFSFTSFTEPGAIYRHDVLTGENRLLWRPVLGFDASPYETTQVFFRSKDGTSVPMFLTMRKGTPRDGRNPVILYGYGGFAVSLTPAFSPTIAAWLEMGGIYAVANLRGGSEYGEEWHEAGMLARKQNVFDDFIAAAEWLIDSKLTSTPKLAISGGSNGGLLVGAAITQRPDLFGAALPAVGVHDMLRFHKFTIGWAWVDDYGSPEDPEMFKVLHAYSPLHNVKPGTRFPPTLITTADHDDRVVPAHSFKFAATLQAAQEGENPVLIRIETKAGHGAGKPTAKLIEETADRLSFLVRTLDIELPAPATR